MNIHTSILDNGILSFQEINGVEFVFREPAYRIIFTRKKGIEMVSFSCISGKVEMLDLLSEDEVNELVNSVYKDRGFGGEKKNKNTMQSYELSMNLMILNLCKFFPGWTIEQIVEYPYSKISAIIDSVSYMNGRKMKKSVQREYESREEAAKAFAGMMFGR